MTIPSNFCLPPPIIKDQTGSNCHSQEDHLSMPVSNGMSKVQQMNGVGEVREFLDRRVSFNFNKVYSDKMLIYKQLAGMHLTKKAEKKRPPRNI